LKPIPVKLVLMHPMLVHQIVIRGIERRRFSRRKESGRIFLYGSSGDGYAWELMTNHESASSRLNHSDRIDYAPSTDWLCSQVQSRLAGPMRTSFLSEKELTGPTGSFRIARVRVLVVCIAIRGLSISGSGMARRLNVDRSAISRPVQRTGNVADHAVAASTITGLLKS